jgi:hypothetical protein
MTAMGASMPILKVFVDKSDAADVLASTSLIQRYDAFTVVEAGEERKSSIGHIIMSSSLSQCSDYYDLPRSVGDMRTVSAGSALNRAYRRTITEGSVVTILCWIRKITAESAMAADASIRRASSQSQSAARERG